MKLSKTRFVITSKEYPNAEDRAIAEDVLGTAWKINYIGAPVLIRDNIQLEAAAVLNLSGNAKFDKEYKDILVMRPVEELAEVVVEAPKEEQEAPVTPKRTTRRSTKAKED